MVLGYDAKQDSHRGTRGRIADWHCPHVRRPAGSGALACVADAQHLGLCDGLVPGRERCAEGGADQVVHAECSSNDCG